MDKINLKIQKSQTHSHDQDKLKSNEGIQIFINQYQYQYQYHHYLRYLTSLSDYTIHECFENEEKLLRAQRFLSNRPETYIKPSKYENKLHELVGRYDQKHYKISYEIDLKSK
jgi:hypothetical protein